MKFLVLHANNAVPKVCSLFFQQWQPPNIENWRGEAVADLGGGGAPEVALHHCLYGIYDF